VLALALLVASIALADSLNPSTVLPALYLSTTPHAVRKIAGFALGFSLTSLAFGIAFVAGPGQLILDVLPHLSHNAKHLIEVGVGVALIALGVGLWLGGAGLAERIPKGESESARSSFVLGAGIMAVELPTAFPYLAALAAIIGADLHLLTQFAFVGLFNFVFALPVLAILVLRARATEKAERRIVAIGEWVRKYAHVTVAVIAALAGVGFVVVGVAGLR
jgi:cytochrome c biogenesis protein CcdA